MTPRKVDPYVYVMEWIWRHSTAKGVVQHVLLRIGRGMRWTPSGFETGPLPTQEIARDTGLADSTVRKQLEALGASDGDIEIVRSNRRGETYRYRLRREQLLPLTDLQPSVHSRMAAVTAPPRSGESPPDGGGDSADWQRSDRRVVAVPVPDSGGVSGDVSFSSEVRTDVRSTTTTYEDQAAVDFLTWFGAAYAAKRGYPYVVKRSAALAVIIELQRDRSDERLQAMATLMLDAVHDTFIRASDYSLFVLQHKATYLEGIAVKNERQREAVG